MTQKARKMMRNTPEMTTFDHFLTFFDVFCTLYFKTKQFVYCHYDTKTLRIFAILKIQPKVQLFCIYPKFLYFS